VIGVSSIGERSKLRGMYPSRFKIPALNPKAFADDPHPRKQTASSVVQEKVRRASKNARLEIQGLSASRF
jgi:hypothetical protein